nr:Arm DNA-binding domain-containing protein [Photobacterium carnosum]
MDVTGLECLSGKTGSKRFLLRYQINGKKSSIAIGRFPDVDLSTARKIVSQYLLAIGAKAYMEIFRQTINQPCNLDLN